MTVILVCVVAELGDWTQIEDHDYVSNMRMLPKQSLKFTDKVMDLHKSLELVAVHSSPDIVSHVTEFVTYVCSLMFHCSCTIFC